MQPAHPTSDAIWTVSALNFEVKQMLNQGMGTLWIEGEISNFACPASGHWYFTLKDEKAQCRAAMFRGRNSRVGFVPQNGQKVLLRAQVTLYEARGEFQLVVDHLEDAGVGELMRRYEQLKAQLAQEGLFDAALKKPLPPHPQKIALVTSASGAAIRDVLSVIERRAPHIPVVVFPTQVQGETAAVQIRAALKQVLTHGECDVVLLVRGGGSLEDLWCFNDEALARDIAAYPLPLVTGVGHEIDFTIADFAADLRAPTPSVAAETISPDINEMMQGIDDRVARLRGQISLRLGRARERLSYLQKALQQQHPTRQFEQLRLRLQHAYDALLERLRFRLGEDKHRLQICQATLMQVNPQHSIDRQRERLARLLQDHEAAMRQKLLLANHRLDLQLRSLDAFNPAKTLARGFATVSKDDKLVTSVKQLSSGDRVDITLRDGKKPATID
ncbi:MAG: exodeoxyribonuclease VII large subunit [Gammaproteobacteria bacterium]|nr:MAG: exodeoxyribonuclease VII large subunit [Gammaproteobacteria bacterium]UCH41637.1 MAG: exodeoxyribonuclease VII large subunit [Gammaproteobacteria bacterium]